MAHQDAFHPGLLTPIIIVAREDDIFVGFPLGELEGTGTGGIQRQPCAAEIAVLFIGKRRLAVDDRARTILCKNHQQQIGIIGLWNIEHEGLVVFGNEELVGLFQLEAAGLQEGRLRQVASEQPLQAPDHVFCRHRIAGREFGIAAQMKTDGFPVFGNFPAFGKTWLDAAIFR
ncbi:hypothetical protein D3C78_1003960 [compost metagenome]